MMEAETGRYRWGLLAKWFIATAIGWIVGVIMAIVLSYAVVNLFYKEETNLIVGLSIAFFVGLAQMIAARGALPFSWRWIWGSTLGIGIPSMIAILIAERTGTGTSFGWWLVLLGVIGAAITGIIQAGVLKGHALRPKCWIGASVISWGLVWLSNVIIGENGMAVGGLVLGAVGGVMLVVRVRIER
jgi:hypothetical protein